MTDLVVIGGTGVYGIDRVQDVERVAVDTPFGPLESPLLRGSWGGRPVAFLARHGEQHSVLPHEVNYRANVWAVAQLAPRAVVAVNAVGSLDDRLPPAALALPDQLLDYTFGRASTFYGDVPEAPIHVDFTHPYDGGLHAAVARAAGDDLAVSRDLVYGVTQGPRLETAAEIRRMRQDGCGLVGMTGMPEAVLARELGLAYVSLCLIGNWAAGFRPDEPEITLDEVLENVSAAMESALGVIERLLVRAL
ncbi:MAG: S-methyl-5'-thioinosine phosphorylase [Pseudomonadota bacterium]